MLFNKIFATVVVCSVILASCSKEPVEKLTVPTVITNNPNSVTSVSAIVGGRITYNPPTLMIAEKGVYIGLQDSPEKTGQKFEDLTGGSSGEYMLLITHLLPNKTFYVKAYARNDIGIGYGNQVTFTTLAQLSSVSTTQVTQITSNSAISGGKISNDGGATITTRGVCWNTSQNPQITNNKTTDGQGTGDFVSTLSNLLPNTKYYLRAYATNSAGTQYGEELSFQTFSNAVPSLTTSNVTIISSSSAELGGTINNQVNETILEKGVYIANQTNPELSGTKIIFHVNDTDFYEDVYNLLPNTKYYVKAFAKNNVGIGLGQEITFTTKQKDYIEVGNVKWSLYNVNYPGTFTTSQYEYGMYYQWSRKIGWSYQGIGQYFDQGPSYSNPPGKSWSYDYDYSINEWREVDNPCPYSFRLPTFKEFQQMLSYVDEYGWYTLTNDKSKIFIKFTFYNNSVLYFPGAGYRDTGGSAVGKTESNAHYWAINNKNALVIDRNKNIYNHLYTGTQALLVRCVKK